MLFEIKIVDKIVDKNLSRENKGYLGLWANLVTISWVIVAFGDMG
jgi:hypothetical protein